MKILIINNHSKRLKELLKELKNFELIDFKEIAPKDYNKYDAIILSGGSVSILSHKKEYAKEIKLIKNSKNQFWGFALDLNL